MNRHVETPGAVEGCRGRGPTLLRSSVTVVLAAALVALALVSPAAPVRAADEPVAASPVALSPEQRDFMTWRFGMFLHFNLGTFADLDWAGGYEDPGLFQPARLDCGQWADAARERV